MKRTLITLGALALAVLVGGLLAVIGSRNEDTATKFAGTQCATLGYVVLEAQSVRSATLIPCVAETLEGWSPSEETYDDGSSRLVLRTGATGGAQWIVTFTPACAPDPNAVPDPETDRTYERRTVNRIDQGTAIHSAWYQFSGGCVTSRIEIPDRFDEQRIFDELDAAFTLVDRAEVDRYVRERSGGDFGLDPR